MRLVRSLLVWTTMFGLAATGCGDDPPFPESNRGPCGFRVDGDTVDKVNESTVLGMDGSTLGMSCQHIETGFTEVRLTIQIKAFDGARLYQLDSTDTFGGVSYYSNDGLPYFNIGDSVLTGCTIDVKQAPANPRLGDVLEATFGCTHLEGYAGNNVYKYVDILDGSFEGAFTE